MPTKNIHIDATRAYTLLKKAVERKGEAYVTPQVQTTDLGGGYPYTYNTRCLYTYESKSLCPVGVALSIAGVTQEELNVSGPASDLDELLPSRVHFTDAALAIFRAAQCEADAGHTWGEALAEAYKVAPVAHSER